MKNFTYLVKYPSILFFLFFLGACVQMNEDNEKKENDMYDGPDKAAEYEYNITKDPATGKVPREKLLAAVDRTMTAQTESSSLISALTWTERGPNSDVPGPSNGNTRANSGITSGRIRAIMVDSTDATYKTVWIGGVDGGLWKTTDITASPATWTMINDNLSNLAVADICQDPRPGFTNIMYFCTGESYLNLDAVRGNGVFKSTDGGATWSHLSSTSTFVNGTRVLCDYLGNVYLATRGAGLRRSTNGGTSWTNITPTGMNTSICDLEISSTSAAGRLHVVAGIFNTQSYRYTDIAATVSSGAGWNAPATAFPSYNMRAEIACRGNTLYALPADGSYMVPTIYKSTDGGANWAATGGQPSAGWASGQGWYALAVEIDPSNSNNCIIGGLDTWKTTNGGASWSQISTWVGTFPVNQYVHADVHKILWFDGGNKLLFGCDGGIHYSTDKGATIRDRNAGLRIKQFYSVAIHPTLTNYFLAGAQDNGTHQFSNAGLSSTIEVQGGDGAYVAIDQDEPQYQFGSYVYNQYRRSTNGGATWSAVNLSSSTGQFINPFDYDNTANIMYCSDAAGSFRRWTNPQTGSSSAVVNITGFNAGSVMSVSVSPYTANRVYFGTSNGRVVRVDGANTIASGSAGTNISTGLPGGTVSCINQGTDDQNLICSFSNYGLNSVWVSTNGGTSWTSLDNNNINLPDMPVRWCMFYPGDNTRAYIATETGVWETDLINGTSTVWTANSSFPTVRTDMIKYRSSDRTIAAATHGRGLWTAVIPSVSTPDLQFQDPAGSATEATAFTSGCRGYTDYTANMVILNAPTGNATVTLGIAGGATATQGVDYAVTTNGDFVSPSMVLNFPGGSTLAQPFTIRVYDDAALEPAETFTLNYTISGGSNAQAGGSNQTYTFTINSNDAAPFISGSGTSGTIGALNYITSAGQSCFFSSNTRHKIQYLVTRAELNAAGINAAADFNSLKFRVFTKNSTKPYSGFTVSLGNTAVSSFSNFISGGFTQVYTGAYSTVAGDNTINFATNFAWDGTSNIAVNICYQNATADAGDDIMEADVPAIAASYSVYANYTSGGTAGCSLSASFLSGLRPNMAFGYILAGTTISTVLNSTSTAYLGPNDDVYFYDGSGNIMARIRNLTAFDYGCTQLTIDRAGTSTVNFWNSNVINNLLSKTLKVVPANNTTTGHYQVTLYYTATAVNNWQTATGRLWSEAQAVKVSNGFYIPDITPAAPHSSSVTVITATAATFGSHYTLTGDFNNTGFSGFGAGVPGFSVLPININYFTGARQAAGHLLNWKVDCNATPRVTITLERSTDSRNFSSLYAVTADALRCYQPFDFTDNRPLSGMNYYRLKLQDIDGKISYSSIVALLNAFSGFEIISIAPNPVTGGNFNLNVSSAIADNMDVFITDKQGRLVKKLKLALTAGFNSIPVNVSNLAAGSYTVYGMMGNTRSKVLHFIKQ